eukprot:TRINITY_DN67269_c8_g1_i1.p1 TRINITY_DN67269_c8_g1~~TRINITY_DN67269_c8_g1_i1.p1  ORF type:complete len:1492 (+),score=177.50 TRINITY_DN67269_c8_g1_i1:52-4527(+)
MTKLNVVVQNATGLSETCDPYVELTVDKTVQQTRVKKNESNPQWNETFEFDVAIDSSVQRSVSSQDPSQYLQVCLYDSNWGPDSQLSAQSLSLANLSMGIPQQMPLMFNLRNGGSVTLYIQLTLLGSNSAAADAPTVASSSGGNPTQLMTPPPPSFGGSGSGGGGSSVTQTTKTMATVSPARSGLLTVQPMQIRGLPPRPIGDQTEQFTQIALTFGVGNDTVTTSLVKYESGVGVWPSGELVSLTVPLQMQHDGHCVACADLHISLNDQEFVGFTSNIIPLSTLVHGVPGNAEVPILSGAVTLVLTAEDFGTPVDMQPPAGPASQSASLDDGATASATTTVPPWVKDSSSLTQTQQQQSRGGGGGGMVSSDSAMSATVGQTHQQGPVCANVKICAVEGLLNIPQQVMVASEGCYVTVFSQRTNQSFNTEWVQPTNQIHVWDQTFLFRGTDPNDQLDVRFLSASGAIVAQDSIALFNLPLEQPQHREISIQGGARLTYSVHVSGQGSTLNSSLAPTVLSTQQRPHASDTHTSVDGIRNTQYSLGNTADTAPDSQMSSNATDRSLQQHGGPPGGMMGSASSWGDGTQQARGSSVSSQQSQQQRGMGGGTFPQSQAQMADTRSTSASVQMSTVTSQAPSITQQFPQQQSRSSPPTASKRSVTLAEPHEQEGVASRDMVGPHWAGPGVVLPSNNNHNFQQPGGQASAAGGGGPPAGANLGITVQNGYALKGGDMIGKSDIYVVLRVGTSEYKTSVKDGPNPSWNEKFYFTVDTQGSHQQGCLISREEFVFVDVYDKDRFSKDDLLGRAQVRLQNLTMGFPKQAEIPVSKSPGGKLVITLQPYGWGLPPSAQQQMQAQYGGYSGSSHVGGAGGGGYNPNYPLQTPYNRPPGWSPQQAPPLAQGQFGAVPMAQEVGRLKVRVVQGCGLSESHHYGNSSQTGTKVYVKLKVGGQQEQQTTAQRPAMGSPVITWNEDFDMSVRLDPRVESLHVDVRQLKEVDGGHWSDIGSVGTSAMNLDTLTHRERTERKLRLNNGGELMVILQPTDFGLPPSPSSSQSSYMSSHAPSSSASNTMGQLSVRVSHGSNVRHASGQLFRVALQVGDDCHVTRPGSLTNNDTTILWNEDAAFRCTCHMASNSANKYTSTEDVLHVRVLNEQNVDCGAGMIFLKYLPYNQPQEHTVSMMGHGKVTLAVTAKDFGLPVTTLAPQVHNHHNQHHHSHNHHHGHSSGGGLSSQQYGNWGSLSPVKIYYDSLSGTTGHHYSSYSGGGSHRPYGGTPGYSYYYSTPSLGAGSYGSLGSVGSSSGSHGSGGYSSSSSSGGGNHVLPGFTSGRPSGAMYNYYSPAQSGTGASGAAAGATPFHGFSTGGGGMQQQYHYSSSGGSGSPVPVGSSSGSGGGSPFGASPMYLSSGGGANQQSYGGRGSPYKDGAVPRSAYTSQVAWNQVQCDGCDQVPLMGARYKCETCDNWDLCGSCFQRAAQLHDPTHKYLQMHPSPTAAT